MFANPQALTPEEMASLENEAQDHPFSEEERPEHIQPSDLQKLGENGERVEKPSRVTAGQHITSKRQGRDVAAEREEHVRGQRKASEKLFDSKRRSVAPRRVSKDL